MGNPTVERRWSEGQRRCEEGGQGDRGATKGNALCRSGSAIATPRLLCTSFGSGGRKRSSLRLPHPASSLATSSLATSLARQAAVTRICHPKEGKRKQPALWGVWLGFALVCLHATFPTRLHAAGASGNNKAAKEAGGLALL